jgi:UDP-N-acetylmuramate dehydrogenase
MASSAALAQLAEFGDIVKPSEPLAPYTYLKLGGPAEALVQPRSAEELSAVVRRCLEKQLPLRVLGGGCSILIRDEGVSGVVLRLSAPAFTQVTVEGKRVRSGGGAALSALISEAARQALAGLEGLVGTPGTVGGALRQQAADPSGEIGQYLTQIQVIDAAGKLQTHLRDDLRFSSRWTNLDDPVFVSAEFELEKDEPGDIVKRMRKAWIKRKATQPFSFQAAGRIFQNPRGLNAAALIEQAELAGARVGGAEVSDRDANFIIAHTGATARDVLRLIDMIRSRVRECFHVDLELDISVW